MRLRKVVETLWEISRPTVRSATAKPVASLPTPSKLRRNQQKSSQVPCSPFLTYIRQKIDATDSLSHRQIRSEVYTRSSVSNLRFSLNQGGFEWPYRHISLNWNGNTRASKTNYTKRSSTFQRTTCE